MFFFYLLHPKTGVNLVELGMDVWMFGEWYWRMLIWDARGTLGPVTERALKTLPGRGRTFGLLVK